MLTDKLRSLKYQEGLEVTEHHNKNRISNIWADFFPILENMWQTMKTCFQMQEHWDKSVECNEMGAGVYYQVSSLYFLLQSSYLCYFDISFKL